MIDRRAFVQGIVLGALAGPLAARAQPAHAHRVPRVGILGEVDPIGWMVRTSAVEVECRWAEGPRDRLRDLAAELVELGVDVIVAAGASSARAAASVTATTPIVFVAGVDRARDSSLAGLAGRGAASPASWCRPRPRSPPSASGSWRRWRPTSTTWPCSRIPTPRSLGAQSGTARAAASRQGVELRSIEARTLAEAAASLHRCEGDRAGSPARAAGCAVRDRTAAHRRPRRPAPDARALLRSLLRRGRRPHGLVRQCAGEVIRRAATLVARVLAGARPASVPVEALAPLVLTVNADAAQTMGLAMPRSLLARADAVIRA